MNNIFLKIIFNFLKTIIVLMPHLAFAETAAPQSPHTFTGNVTLASEYRFRGISQTYKQPAIQGGFDYAHASGFYAGTWASNVNGSLTAGGPTYTNGNMEWDFYGGYKGKFSDDLGYDVGLLYYYYPGAEYNLPTRDKYNNTEIYGAISYKWFTFKYNYTLSDFFGTNTNTFGGFCGINRDTGTAYTATNAPDGCIGTDPGGSKGSGYADFTFAYEFADKWTVGAHIGRQIVRHYSLLNYTDYKVSVNKEFGGFNFGLAFITTDAKKPFYTGVKTSGGNVDSKVLSDNTLVLSVSKTF